MNLSHRLDKLELERGKTDPMAGFGGFQDPRWCALGEAGDSDGLQREYPRWCQFFSDLLRKPPKPDSSAPDKPVFSRNETG